MSPRSHLRLSDLRGYSQLVIDATIGVTDLVETMHQTIVRSPGILGTPTQDRAGGVTGFVYSIVRGVTRVVGFSIDAVLQPLVPLLKDQDSSNEREAILAAINGILGDHLLARNNPLRIEMQLRRNGQALVLTPEALAAAIPEATGKILLLVHGLCMSDRQWLRKGHDHGIALEAEIGVTVVYVNYNSGLPVSANGSTLTSQLDALLAAWPVPVEYLDILGYSMGGLVTRSACHYGQKAGHGWLRYLRKVVFLGTPHHGAPLERGGNWVNVILEISPYTAAFSRLAKIRSAGITDLRYGHLLDEEAGQEQDGSTEVSPTSKRPKDRFAHGPDTRPVVPLPEGVSCYALAAVSAADGEHRRSGNNDGIVPQESALGQHKDPRHCLPIPETNKWTGYGMRHMDLLDRKEVCLKILEYLR